MGGGGEGPQEGWLGLKMLALCRPMYSVSNVAFGRLEVGRLTRVTGIGVLTGKVDTIFISQVY